MKNESYGSSYDEILESLSLLSAVSFDLLGDSNRIVDTTNTCERELLEEFSFCDLSSLLELSNPPTTNIGESTQYPAFEREEVYPPRILKCIFHSLFRKLQFNDAYPDQNHDILDVTKIIESFRTKTIDAFLSILIRQILPKRPVIDWSDVLQIYKIDCPRKCTLVKEDLKYCINDLLLQWYIDNMYISFTNSTKNKIEVNRPIHLVGNLTRIPKWVFVFQAANKSHKNKSIDFDEQVQLENFVNSFIWDDWRFIAAKLETKSVHEVKRCYKRKIRGGKESRCKATLTDMILMYIINKCKPDIDNQTIAERYIPKFNCVELRGILDRSPYKKLESQLNNVLKL